MRLRIGKGYEKDAKRDLKNINAALKALLKTHVFTVEVGPGEAAWGLQVLGIINGLKWAKYRLEKAIKNGSK